MKKIVILSLLLNLFANLSFAETGQSQEDPATVDSSDCTKAGLPEATLGTATATREGDSSTGN